VLRRADERLQEVGLEPVGQKMTRYGFRRLYASALRHRDRLSGKALQEFDRALTWAEMGRIEAEPAAASGPRVGSTVVGDAGRASSCS
jgi:hypothetical protein